MPSSRPLLNLTNLKVYHQPQQLPTTTKHLTIRFSACSPSSSRNPSISRWDASSKLSSIRPTLVWFLLCSKFVAVQHKQQPHPSVPPLLISASEHTYSCLEAPRRVHAHQSWFWLNLKSLPPIIILAHPSGTAFSSMIFNARWQRQQLPFIREPSYVISVPDPT